MARLHRKGIAQTPEVSDIRVLERADLVVLSQPRPAPQIQTIRDSHHRMARAVASGLANAEVAAVCGVSISRVSLLRQDPAFKELVAHKRSMIDVEWAEAADPVVELLKSNALKAQAMISDKIDAAMEAQEFLPTRDLLGIAELGLDRTGYGKVNKNVNVNVDFAASLEAARKRSATAREPRLIEATRSPSLSPQSGQDDRPSPALNRPVSPPPAVLRRL